MNPFDQFGVELGKILASDIRNQIRNKNMDTNYHFDSLNPAVQFYLDTLFKGSL
ncbi:MAG: hypothetical protein R6X10_04465 [Desulfobacterales bacterium]